ncbi:hypothetical protein A3E42_02075 [Candidatus Gottesmanbacteria bacterium RIFCSPHIGHO2_12_FULL_40_13]|uniref:CHRD domain-containing protein n=1 Tax=Candidatus Gottesmanbacteria bacterium RIFCSPHIGHO2_01_FULL_40_15 TaxID=1798376 RepID=A0A1F5YZT6_9BACT|nr:MAG: hypothetical protein A2777_05080 [Candidatus Gottesmanbacteria bacterium RIFCSPHIGHO2_01_FULL_40_15]OGG24869.1 MAG: hypothetical protein A3E42_02075 [Candidatus Gottesmanbacteria bacterium RIFCSPHIGHO2_12_FULL_40_13]OGG33704.1 MAG: hypothetical protein A3I80_05200 [Candidatus Gottesmanbacteria bacterium RIFCSPLOWO2_02_FULL_40_10]
MRRVTLFIILILVVLAGGAIWLNSRQSGIGGGEIGIGGGPETNDGLVVPSPEIRKNEVLVNLMPVVGAPVSQNALALIEEENGQLTVSLAVENYLDNPQPAHIHAGSCPDVGEIIYPLNAVISGNSVTFVNSTFDNLIDRMPLAINIHQSPTELDVYTACGNIVLEGNSGNPFETNQISS